MTNFKIFKLCKIRKDRLAPRGGQGARRVAMALAIFKLLTFRYCFPPLLALSVANCFPPLLALSQERLGELELCVAPSPLLSFSRTRESRVFRNVFAGVAAPSLFGDRDMPYRAFFQADSLDGIKHVPNRDPAYHPALPSCTVPCDSV